MAARSRSEPYRPEPHTPGRTLDAKDTPDRIAALARRWAALAPPGGGHAVADRLATLLHRLNAALLAEPFWPPAARAVGATLLATGLCGDPDDLMMAPENMVPLSLDLLRREMPFDAAGLEDLDRRARVAAVLDEVAAGFAGALLDRGRSTSARPAADRSGGIAPGATELYRQAYEQGQVGVGASTLDGQLLDLNPALRRILGLDPAATALDMPRFVIDLVHPDDVRTVVDRYRRLVRGESDVQRMDLRIVGPDAVVAWVHVVAVLVRHPGGEPSHLVVVTDDTCPRRPRSRLGGPTVRDQLVRLPGPAVTDHWLRRAFADGGSTRVGICSVELDGLEVVNDVLGDELAGRLLLGVAGRMHLAAGEHLVSRTRSGEFAVLVADPENGATLGRLADRLQAVLAAPFVVDGHRVTVTASIGIAEAATARSCAPELVRSAAVARSWASALGGHRQIVFDHERHAGEAARFALVSGLRDGVDRGEFRLAFQPLVDLADGRLLGVEALVRWQHPEQGLLHPGRFIELAERSGAIVPLGRWVLRRSCERAAQWWRELGSGAPFVSVNVSPVELVEPGWLQGVTDVLAATGLPPDRLQLEITEQAVLGDEAVTLGALGALRDVGVRIALDDFGTGYSSMSWLRRLPVHALKIDGSFVDGLRHPDADPVDSSIVRALVEMAHALGVEVTAEWVETDLQAERLAALGCDVGQGHWFGAAGPGDRVPDLWRRSVGR